MKAAFRYLVTGLMVLIICSGTRAQVLLKASVDRDGILIGEPITLELNLHAPLGVEGKLQLPDTIPHFDILNIGEIKSEDGIDGKKWIQQIILTGFDTGHWQIPPLPARVGGKTYFTDTIGISVSYAAFDPTGPYRDIKDIEQVEAPPINYLPWILAGIATLLLALGLFFWFRRKPVKEQAVIPELSPYEEAMQALAKLRQQGWERNGHAKLFYTDLNDILRVFIDRKLQISSLERTNDEIIMQLKKYEWNREEYARLVQALRTADFVKFAQYVPGSKDNEQNFEIIHSAIQSLNNIP